ncbi:MAG TPA: hypothetical protein PLB32_20385, partial [Acidobacteriota bacterium]|nr:hypothetical protein [Acidobacteriota bacterium]
RRNKTVEDSGFRVQGSEKIHSFDPITIFQTQVTTRTFIKNWRLDSRQFYFVGQLFEELLNKPGV